MPNKTETDSSRRHFLKLSTALAVGGPLWNASSLLDGLFPANYEPKVYVFSKHLQFLDYQRMAEAAKNIGFDGVDLTVRSDGHVKPERVEEDLPKATEALQDFELTPSLITTNVSKSNDPIDQQVLATASQLNYQVYRMGWLKYPADQSIPKSMKSFNSQLKSLARLNKKLGISGAYQNHAGIHVGAPVWDIHQLLEGISPDHLGCQYDIRHATVEGGSSWELGLSLLKDRINSIVIKDFKWGKVDGVWKPVNTPLGEGMVDFKRFFQLLKQYQINVPISLHLEYDLGGAEKGKTQISIEPKEVFEHMKKDLLFIKRTWDEVQ